MPAGAVNFRVLWRERVRRKMLTSPLAYRPLQLIEYAPIGGKVRIYESMLGILNEHGGFRMHRHF